MNASIPIEQFSLEAVFLQGIQATLIIVFCFRAAGIFWPTLIPKVDKITNKGVNFFFETGKVIPLFMAAFFIAVSAPIFELYMDGKWFIDVLQDGGYLNESITNNGALNWAQIVIESDTSPIKDNLNHSIQIGAAALIFWAMFVFLNFVISKVEQANTIQTQNFIRIAILLFALSALNYFAELLTSIGQNPLGFN